MRFPNIHILSYIIYYIHPLTIIVALAIKAVGFFAMHCGDIIFYYFRLNSPWKMGSFCWTTNLS